MTVTRPEAAKLESHPEQLARLQAEVEALRKQLSQAHRLATVGTMAAMVAHEFNNILTPIINYAKMASKNPALVGKALAQVADGGARAGDICRAILGVTAGDSGHPRDILVADLVKQTLDAMVRRPAKDRIDMQTNIPAGLKITTRPAELQQVLLNLLINARTAVLAKEGPRRIGISAERSGKFCVICVADNGVGIEPDRLEKIFQPFFSTATRSAEADSSGHGLGLAFCKKMVTELGGEIAVQSTPGKGSTFTLRLPG